MTTGPGHRDAVAATGPIVPDYGTATLGALLPGAAAALGVETGLPALPLPATRGVCVVLVDGLGAMLLDEVAADPPAAAAAPFLTGLLTAPRPADCPAVLRVGTPTTTATSMGSFGTGLPPGQHGLLGYQVRDPARGALLNELRWDPYTDPLDWQPLPTVFGRCEAAGVSVLRIGDPAFAGSGLTLAAHRGGRFVGATGWDERADAVVRELSESDRSLVYLYWGSVDAAGHAYGWRSPEWRAALSDLDTGLQRLAAQLPAGTELVITADHGMVDVPRDDRLDLADRPALREGIALLGGEPRLTQIYCRGGHTDRVLERIGDAVGDRAWVRTRDEAIAEGWFGPVSERVRPRIGDVLVAARGTFAIVDSEVMHRTVVALIGHHGSLTEAEQLVPLLYLQA